MTNNVSSMPTDWWAWDGDNLHPLGVCEDIDNADERASKLPILTNWLFSRESLEDLRIKIEEELK